jgi:hypothetical protein
MADFTTRDKVALLKDFLNVVGTETEGVEVKVTRDADNGMRFYSDPEVVVEVKNATLAQLDAGTPVYVSGTAASGKPEVSPAQANSATTMPAIGLIQDDIASGDEGFVVAGGLVVGLDTDTPAWDDGTALYVSPTVAGGLTDTRPTGTTELVQKVALVTRRHATVGSVIVMGAGRTNDIPNDLVTLTGVPLGDSDLGTFTGTTIADNETIKGALQDLETAVEAGGGGGVKYHGRYDTEAETARSDASTTTEIYYTARPDGDGYAESEVDDSGVPVGDTVIREIYFHDEFDADPDGAGWTAYTTQPAQGETFANAKAALLAGLNDTNGTANTRGTLPLSLKMERTVVTNLLLDDYPGAAAGYSLRKIDRNYTGNAIRIREDSGNTETDIGFTSGGDLDTAAIASHCGANNGYVVTWYDQSGNGNDATQSTASAQPKIYNGTSVVTDNGEPAIEYDGSSDTLPLPDAVLPSALNNCSAFTVQANTGGISLQLGQDDPGNRWYQSFVSSGTEYFGYAGGAFAINLGTASTAVKLVSVIAGSTQGNTQGFINGTSKGSVSLNGNTPTTGSAMIGRSGLTLAGTIQEAIVYHSDQSSNRSGIESDIITHYFGADLFLETYSGAAAAYSVRKLSKYQGLCMKVRRDSDNTTQDIGFDSNGDLDTAAIAAFCTTANGYVDTWYDQSGNGNDATQSTTTQQPQIYNGTAVLTENGKACAQWDGSSDRMAFTTTASVNNALIVSSSSDDAAIHIGTVSESGILSLMQDGATSTVICTFGSSAKFYADGTLACTNGVQTRDDMHTAFSTGSQVLMFVDDVSVPADDYTIGTYAGSSFWLFAGKIQEVVLFSTDHGGNRTGIESNINTYYSIY